MGLLTELKHLFGDHDTVQPDQSWPIETAEYYVDDSINQYQLPPTAAMEDHWAPTADQVIPYRGVEDHGVPYDATSNYVIPVAPDTTEPDTSSVQEYTEVLTNPIPVTVVEMPIPRGREYRVATAQWALVNAAEPTQVAPKSYRRNQVHLAVTGTDVVWISTDKQQVKSQGFPVIAGMAMVNLDCTDAIYAYAPTANATLYVLEEYEVSTNEHPV